MRMKLYFDLLRSLKLPAPMSAYATVTINGKYWGVYLIAEVFDSFFLRREFSDASGYLFRGEPRAYLEWKGKEEEAYYRDYQLVKGEASIAWKELISLIEILHKEAANEEKYKSGIERALNLDECLQAWAVNNICVNVDAYNMKYPHNYYLYYNPSTLKWNWISDNGYLSFGAWAPELLLSEMERFSILHLDTSLPKPCAEKFLLENFLIQSRYGALMKENVLQVWNEKSLNMKIDSLYALIKDVVYRDTMKMYSSDDFNMNIVQATGDSLDPGAFVPGLKSFISRRKKYVEKELKSLGL
jgi:hypothetical protein